MLPLHRFHQAASLLENQIIKTPLIHSPFLSASFGGEIFLKLENLQKTGSFKIRGALYKMLTILDHGHINGVVAASAGNHAQGVAMAATAAGLPAFIIMPEWSSITKQEATKGYGGKVILAGQSIAESLERAEALVHNGKAFIHPYDDIDIIIGQGTIGLEILDILPDLDIIIVPIGGGGLISGISTVIRSIKPRIKIIGVQAAHCPSASEAINKGKRVCVQSKPSIADGIQVKQIGQKTFEIIQECVDEIVLVNEEEIAAAMLMLMEHNKILAEGAGAAALGALLNHSVAVPRGQKAVLLISGGNIDSSLLGRIINKGLLNNGRIMRINIVLHDKPGSLSNVLNLVARLNANLLYIYHDRNKHSMAVDTACVEITLETRGHAHIKAIRSEFQKAGYPTD